MTLHPKLERVQTGVRMERRLVKVLKAVAELRDVSLGSLLEALMFDTFAGWRSMRAPWPPTMRPCVPSPRPIHSSRSARVLARAESAAS